jgi:hypothetical protein
VEAGVDTAAALGCVVVGLGRRGKRVRATFRAASVSAAEGRAEDGGWGDDWGGWDG